MNAWRCDRCGKVSQEGDIDDPPDGWHHDRCPVRGSQGARSNDTGLLCDDCDDSFYDWWHNQ